MKPAIAAWPRASSSPGWKPTPDSGAHRAGRVGRKAMLRREGPELHAAGQAQLVVDRRQVVAQRVLAHAEGGGDRLRAGTRVRGELRDDLPLARRERADLDLHRIGKLAAAATGQLHEDARGGGAVEPHLA